MKTKYWIILLTIVLAVCLGLSFWLFGSQEEATAVKVISKGELKYTLPLNVDTQVQITTDRGTNTVTVKDGMVAVTEADCPDGYCMKRGFCSSGTQIVCLPNRLVLEFVGEQTVDGIAG